jgi:hypothetical protein
MDTTQPKPGDFLDLLWMPLISGVALILLSPIIKRWSGGVK